MNSEDRLKTDYIQYGGADCNPSIEEMEMFVTERKQVQENTTLKGEVERLKGIEGRNAELEGRWEGMTIAMATVIQERNNLEAQLTKAREGLEAIASVDKSFVEANGEEQAFMMIIDTAQQALKDMEELNVPKEG